MRTRKKLQSGSLFIIRSGTPTAPAKTRSTPLASPFIRSDSWLDDAGCTTVPVEVFYGTDDMPLTHREKEQAKYICSTCPVQPDCLAHSLKTRENWGIWGGLDERERRALLKETQAASPQFIKVAS
jgi:WhiB family transcriptional regulator, redox-sensing transcriptional regulator